ncbi:methyltransferase [Rhizohabitans arisaemae]|uniref:methyltransferase n=1 Tax=Rhizohabitans arisaemae TaxID=2720610 RepID=UPI0024B1135A|nr:methyltransferase [Rhizohabitans arisaemae]
MTQTVDAGDNTPTPAHDVVIGLRESFLTFTVLAAFAEHGIADRLADGPRTAAELAHDCGLDAAALTRVLPILIPAGILHADAQGRYRLTPAGETLKEGPDSLRATIRLAIEPAWWTTAGNVAETLRTGKSGFIARYGSSWNYLSTRPTSRSLFDHCMIDRSQSIGRDIAGRHDFGDIRSVIDVGGGAGTVLSEILGPHGHLTGTVLDLEPAIPSARDHLTAQGLTGRFRTVAGDFFQSVPGADEHPSAFLLASILHNWDDDHAQRILNNVAAAMGRQDRLLIAETPLPDDPCAPHPGRLLDLRMLIMFNGARERTESELRGLLDTAGLRVTGIVPLPSGPSLITAERV